MEHTLVEDSAKTKVTPPKFKVSKGFAGWLKKAGGSLVFSARRLNKVYTVGLDANDEVAFFERTYPEPMGLHVQGTTLLLADKFRIWRFENAVKPNTQHPFDGFDGIFVAETMFRTGLQDIHDIGFLKNGMIAFASSRMNCVGGTSSSYGIVPLWKPYFIKDLKYEDHCHLNGLAIEDGTVKYITALSDTDTFEGWRNVRADGGILMDVKSGEIVLDGLSMPHAPRLHKGDLWLINSGTGEIGKVDFKKKAFIPKVTISGFARGLSFVNDSGIICSSKLRESVSFQDLPLENKLKKEKTEDQCGLYVFDVKTGKIEHSIVSDNDTLEEIFDVVFVPGVKRIMLSGFYDQLSEQMITVAPVLQ